MKSLFFSIKILDWYRQNKRNLPWRDTSNPYNIWISEVILQQTRIEHGTSYYHNFIKQFPNIESLANASEDKILKLWQGLGYYSRARNLYAGAKQIQNNFNGIFPEKSSDLIKIKGIGEYTAAAIASIAFREPVAAIDGNVYRVMSRYFGIDAPIDTVKGKKQFKLLANEIINKKMPGEYNQAVMEFGALHCTPKNPACTTCPLQKQCQAYLSGTINLLPVKSKKQKIRNRYFYYLVIENNDSFFVKKRTENDIWKNLFDFPLIETRTANPVSEIAATHQWENLFDRNEVTLKKVSEEFIQLLSHQRIHAWFVHISVANEKKLPSNFLMTGKKDISELAVPKIIENYLLKMGII